MEEYTLADLVEDGLSTMEIAALLGVDRQTVRARMRDDGLTSSVRHAAPKADLRRQLRTCVRHGQTEFVERSDGGGWRCVRCRSEAVTRRRRRVKQILIAEAGGACALCGYDRCNAALEFHHLEPGLKAFGLGARGVARSLARAQAEAAKCILLCSNCHVEVESGVAALPGHRYDVPRGPG